MFCKRILMMCAILAASASISGASAANAKWPLSIVGSWKGISNQSPIVLSVTSQTSGTTLCDNISGTIQDVNGDFSGNMIGYYCPSSGAVEFLRYPSNSNVPFQVYSANVSQTQPPAGEGVLMGGVFSQYNLAYGPLGQYSFSLVK